MLSIRPKQSPPERARTGSLRVTVIVGGFVAVAAALALMLL